MHRQCGFCVESVIKSAFEHKTMDNVTVVMVCFENFQRDFFEESPKELKKSKIENPPVQAPLKI